MRRVMFIAIRTESIAVIKRGILLECNFEV
jgi:hypothetical protein